MDGSDVLRVREAVAHCVEAARRGQGPSVVEALTHRLGGHNVGQNLKEDELADEARATRTRDPATHMLQPVTIHHVHVHVHLWHAPHAPPSQERAALRKDPLFVLRGHLALSLGDAAAAAEAIHAIDVRVAEEAGTYILRLYVSTHLPWLPLLLPGACGRGG